MIMIVTYVPPLPIPVMARPMMKAFIEGAAAVRAFPVAKNNRATRKIVLLSKQTNFPLHDKDSSIYTPCKFWESDLPQETKTTPT